MTKNKKISLIVGAILMLLVVVLVCLFAFKDKEKSTYTVMFNSNGGSTISEQVVEEGNSATKPIDPKKDGYIFIEWLLDGKSYDFNSVVDKDITLTANWTEDVPEKELVKVTFNTDGGTTVANAVIEKGSKVSKPENPTKEGYTFVEWQLSGSKYDFGLEVNEDLELIAKWEKNKTENKSNNKNTGNNNSSNNNSKNNNSGTTTPTVKKYTVSFNSNGGSSVAKQTVEQGKKASKPANPTRSGYTFDCWTLNGNAYNFNSAVNENITLVAKWIEIKKAKYTVSFNSNGGTAVNSQVVTEGGKASKPANPTKEGYNFSGWTLNGVAYNFNSAVNGNITLVANWMQKSYIVKVTNVDQYSPDRILTVYEDGNKINVSAIKYNGVTLCNGSNMVVNMYEISGVSSVTVVLINGTSVTASVQ